VSHAFAQYLVVNECNAPEHYVTSVTSSLKEAYDVYCRDVQCPALCPNFHVVLSSRLSQMALTYGSLCATRMEFACDLQQYQIRHMAFHEMAHALQMAVQKQWGAQYSWYVEAHAEGLASVYIAGDRWQHYGHVSRFWDNMLYTRNPFSLTEWTIDWYRYGAFFAWLAWRYGAHHATQVYSSSVSDIAEAYIQFLLSPWTWGREPPYQPFNECNGALAPNTARYCMYYVNDWNGTYVIKSNVLVNATPSGNLVKLAFASTQNAQLSVTVTFSPCPPPTTTTVTTTTIHATTTYTTTLTKTQTVTLATTITEHVTKTETIYVTSAATETITQTVTEVVTKTETGYEADSYKEHSYVVIAAIVITLIILLALLFGKMQKSHGVHNDPKF